MFDIPKIPPKATESKSQKPRNQDQKKIPPPPQKKKKNMALLFFSLVFLHFPLVFMYFSNSVPSFSISVPSFCCHFFHIGFLAFSVIFFSVSFVRVILMNMFVDKHLCLYMFKYFQTYIKARDFTPRMALIYICIKQM